MKKKMNNLYKATSDDIPTRTCVIFTIDSAKYETQK